MDRIGLSFEEYAELKVRPRVGADAAFQHAAQMTLAEMFPMTLMAASGHLRSRGYDCRPAMLEVLVRDGVVKPAEPNAWARTDVDAAAEHFEQCDLLHPYATMCQTLGCRYADFLRPLLEAAVDVRKVPAVTIIAYNGGVMSVPVWGPVVIDLAGLDLAGSVALLSDHDSTRRGIVGHGRAQVRDGRLVVTGTISSTGEAAREIVDASKNGFPWQASVGVEILERRRVDAGQTVAVNG